MFVFIRYFIAILVLLFFSGCASTHDNMVKEMDEINNRPFLADTIKPQVHDKLVLPPLSVSDTVEGSLLSMDKERRSYRKILTYVDQETNAMVLANNSLLRALKSSELEQRISERMSIRYKYELENQKKEYFWNDLGHRFAEIILFGMFIIK